VPFKTGLIFTTNTPSHGAAAAEEPTMAKLIRYSLSLLP